MEAPQLTLLVERVQPAVSVSVVCIALQVPLAQIGSVRTRVRLPLVEQVIAYVHAVYALYVVVPQLTPSVIRMQACISPVSTVLHVPVPEQRRSDRVRV